MSRSDCVAVARVAYRVRHGGSSTRRYTDIQYKKKRGVAQFARTALNLYYGTEEAMEGRNAFVEKRPVDFGKFRT